KHFYMKYSLKYVAGTVMVLLLLSAFAVPANLPGKNNGLAILNGAWHNSKGSIEQSLIIADGYCMLTKYDKSNKKFIHSFGGPLSAEGTNINLKIEFDSNDKTQVGKTKAYDFSISNNTLISDIG